MPWLYPACVRGGQADEVGHLTTDTEITVPIAGHRGAGEIALSPFPTYLKGKCGGGIGAIASQS